MKTPKSSTPAKKIAPRKSPELKVFIGYADLPAVRRAMGSVGAAVRGAAKSVDLVPLLWRFQQLESSHWRDRAITAALDADLVILATSTPGPLPKPTEQWVDVLLNASRGRPVTLVAITGSTDAWTITIERPAAVAAAAAAPISQQMVA
jgi:hypothetical protein